MPVCDFLEKLPVSVAERGGLFSTSTEDVPFQVHVTPSPSSPTGRYTDVLPFLRSWMQGAIAFVFGKFIQPMKRPSANDGSSPNANPEEPNATESEKSPIRNTGCVTPFCTATQSGVDDGAERVLEYAEACGATSGTETPPT